ncbi:MAG: hypothetical protein HY657_04470 [Acidobacteria bacterium]|nr:hypothetical protein [Acidobacteriota bacterium]
MDVANAIDAGYPGSPDRVQLEHATAEGRVLFTYNVGDFLGARRAPSRYCQPAAGSEGISRAEPEAGSRFSILGRRSV